MRWLYTLLLYLISPLVLVRLYWRARRAPAYRQRIAERFALFAPPAQTGGIWVHAVSVGETIAATPMIRALLAAHPELAVTVTTMTPTGSERVRALFAGELASGRMFHVYAPYDLPDAVGRFLRRIRPRLLIIVETELWPNLIHGCARRGIPVLLANARLSAKSARGYRRLRWITAPMLRELVRVVAQNQRDGERFLRLGLAPECLSVSGSIKFDLSIDAAIRERAGALRAAIGPRPVWIAASTHEGEDEILLAAHRDILQSCPEALLILVPRHPERFDAVAGLIRREGFPLQRRSAGDSVAAPTQVLLGDTMGELLLLFGVADIAFVGGSLVPRGGHNTLEPAAWGLPVLTGASDFNFREISGLLRSSGALVKCDSAAPLAAEVVHLLHDAPERQRRGAAARAVVDANRGALERLLVAIDAELAQLP